MNPLVQEILELADELQEKFDSLQNKVNSALSWVPWGLGWVVDKVHDAWDYLVSQWNDFWEDANYIFGNVGDTGSLETTSQSWSSQVGGPVSGQVGIADRALLQADDHWTGQAANAYFPKSALHKSSLQAVESLYADSARGALDTVRGGLTKFYAGLITALGTLIAGFIAAFASSATIIGIPAGIFIAAGACLIAIGAFYAGGTLLKSDCTSAQTDLVASMNNNAAFPGGAWPPGAILTA